MQNHLKTGKKRNEQVKIEIKNVNDVPLKGGRRGNRKSRFCEGCQSMMVTWRLNTNTIETVRLPTALLCTRCNAQQGRSEPSPHIRGLTSAIMITRPPLGSLTVTYPTINK